MMLRRVHGLMPAVQLRDEMDRLFTNFFGPQSANRTAARPASFPALNVWEEGDTFHVEAELPGVKLTDIEISVMGSDLLVRGRRAPRQSGQAEQATVIHRQERGAGEFNRVLRLPVDIDAERVEASLADGVLLVKLPKAESAKPKKIKVQAADNLANN